MKPRLAHAIEEKLSFGLPSSSPLIVAAWYSRLSRSGERPVRTPSFPMPIPKRRSFGILKIAVLGWLVGLAGMLLQTVNTPGSSTHPPMATDTLPQHQSVAQR